MDTALKLIEASLTFGMNPSLKPMQRICALLGNPQQNYVSIQVAGTNGKSSTCRYLAALLRAAGKSTGLYTSPELAFITDRIEIDGTVVADDDFAQAVIRVHSVATEAALELTEFELITAAALLLFSEHDIDYAVLEVGLGGRWDATTVVSPGLVVFTGVDLDHTAVLGETIPEIAREKAAIIRTDSLVVAAPTDRSAYRIFEQRAAEQHAVFIAVPEAEEHEPNSYQAQNKLTALTALRAVLDEETLSDTEAVCVMAETRIPGRLEVLRREPIILIDAAHNPASAQMLANTLSLPSAVLLLAVLADKDASGIIRALKDSFEEIVVTQTASPRAIPVDDLAQLVLRETGKAPRAFATPEEALRVLRQEKQHIVATGSITLAGEVKRLLATEDCAE